MLRRHLVRDLLHAATALTSAPDDRRRHGVSGRVTPGSYVADLRLPRGRSLCREETHAELRVLGRPVAGGDGATGEKRLRTFTPRILIYGPLSVSLDSSLATLPTTNTGLARKKKLHSPLHHATLCSHMSMSLNIFS